MLDSCSCAFVRILSLLSKLLARPRTLMKTAVAVRVLKSNLSYLLPSNIITGF